MNSWRNRAFVVWLECVVAARSILSDLLIDKFEIKDGFARVEAAMQHQP